ncbi:MAG TPA: OmpA family protein, partial [Cyclobacteriaceae bacterium]
GPTQTYTIVTLAAGFQETDRTINYIDPSKSAAEVGADSEFIMSLPLSHVKMGDYIEFSNVRFFQNSVMLHPEAKEELDGLVELMKENPRYKINVHAHCNGTQDRNIVVRGNGQEYFGTSTGNARKTVSAKQLTELRAQLVKDYIVAQGIEARRIRSKGEGGAALIYPVNSILSNRNDRVEIEVKRGK